MDQNKTKCINIFISPNGNDGWKGQLESMNPDGNDGPLLTIQEAQRRIRRLYTDGISLEPINVILRGGRYELNAPITFSPADGKAITFTAYPGEKPVIDGGKRITGWKKEKHKEKHKGQEVWVVHIPEVEKGDWYFRQFFVNGIRRERTRLPKTGFYWMENVPGVDDKVDCWKQFTKGTDTFQYKDKDIQQFRNLHDVDIIVHHFWVDERMPIENIDEQNRIVKSSVRSVFVLLDDVNPAYSKYYVENTYEGLTDPGEWYLDRSTGMLFYIPFEGENLEDFEAYAPVLNQLLRIEGNPTEGKFVENICFEGIAFQHSDWYHTKPSSVKCPDYFNAPQFDNIRQDCASSPQAAVHVPGSIYLYGAKNCTFKNCVFTHMGFYAIELYKGCTYNRI